MSPLWSRSSCSSMFSWERRWPDRCRFVKNKGKQICVDFGDTYICFLQTRTNQITVSLIRMKRTANFYFRQIPMYHESLLEFLVIFKCRYTMDHLRYFIDALLFYQNKTLFCLKIQHRKWTPKLKSHGQYIFWRLHNCLVYVKQRFFPSGQSRCALQNFTLQNFALQLFCIVIDLSLMYWCSLVLELRGNQIGRILEVIEQQIRRLQAV